MKIILSLLIAATLNASSTSVHNTLQPSQNMTTINTKSVSPQDLLSSYLKKDELGPMNYREFDSPESEVRI